MSEIQVARVGLTDYEQLMKNTVRAALREDHEVLRALEIKPYIPTTAEEADALQQTKGLFVVTGFLSLNGETGRVLEFTMEAGLTETEDREIAEQLAEQCVTCVRQMKKDKKRERIRNLVGKGPGILSMDNVKRVIKKKPLVDAMDTARAPAGESLH